MRTVVFLSFSCLFDRKSGAAQSMRAHLQALAAAGWSAHAVTASLFDGDEPYDLATAHADWPLDEASGDWLSLPDAGVVHQVFRAGSTRSKAFDPSEMRQFLQQARERLAALRPDLIVTYGSAELTPLLAEARLSGARTVFYLANPGYAKPRSQEGEVAASLFDRIDAFVMPSQATVDFYQRERGLTGMVVRTPVHPPLDGRINLSPERLAGRHQRYVTMINPEPAKGGLFFLNIVAQARALAPDLRFRVVESRAGRETWARYGVDAAVLEAIDWMPHTPDLARVFGEAAVLLVPSLWFEAAGRVVAEALLAGVPVMAMRSGGIEEQLNGGGFLFDRPAALQQNPLGRADKEDLHRWVNFLRVLMADEAIYRQAVQLALKASSLHEPAQSRAAVVKAYSEIVSRPLMPALADDPRAAQGLADLRERMKQLRESINARLGQGASTASGQAAGAGAYDELLRLSLSQPVMQDALKANRSGNLAQARRLLESYLRLLPEDVTALGVLAQVSAAEGDQGQARRLMERALELAPGLESMRAAWADLVQAQGRAQFHRSV